MDYARLQQKFAENTQEYPAMLEKLAGDLGVTPESLKRLGVGYAPRVRFKTGWNTRGWWATPERDAKGGITGLALRGVQDGSRKVMYHGSKHGFCYPVRHDFDPEAEPYEPGAHNWIRTLEACIPCPVCGKPDGCLLSSENPEDPKAVTCIRERSHRETTFGYLHILKPEGHITPNNPLPPSSRPVLIVEGMSDAAVGLDMGFVAVGRPSARYTAGLPALCQNREVIIVGENDPAGQEGVAAVLAALSSVCRVSVATPPAESKDLRQWRWHHGISADDLEAAATTPTVEETPPILPSADPHPVARAWLREKYWDEERDIPLLRRYGGVWYLHNGVVYQERGDENVLRGELYTWLRGQYTQKENGDTTPYAATRSRVTDIIDALNGECCVAQAPPCWIAGEPVDPRDMAVFDNGILRVDRYLAGEDNYLTPLTPSFFTTNVLPYSFDPDATCPSWDYYLESTFGGSRGGESDQEKLDLLQEWFGYCMVADMSMEKMLMLYGRSGSGKGTALAAFSALLGKHQIAATRMASLSSQFGLEPLTGKLAAIMSDVRLHHGGAMQALENLLLITGGDTIDVPRKHRKNLSQVNLQTRIMIAANELPELPDSSHALMRRLMVIHFQKSFVGREDYTLKDRLRDEAPGIALWALEGLRRLRENGRFTEPASSAKQLEDFRRVTSPVVEFVEDCLLVEEDGVVGYEEMFDLWSSWAETRGVRGGHRTRFEQRLLATLPDVRIETQVHNRTKMKRFRGVEFDTTALRRYT